MRLSLFYNPFNLIDRLAIEINRYRRKRKLKGTAASKLSLGHIDSLELLEIVKKETPTISCVFDVGANIGTWTILAKALFSNAEVHAFEPLALHVNKFNQLTKGLNKVKLHPYCLGAEYGESVINVSSFSDSSSILNATPLEHEQFGIKKASEEPVIIMRIDELIKTASVPVPDLIKLDVQGYELEVLKGAGNCLKQVKYIIAEVSFKEYYYGQPLFVEIANYLDKYGFSVLAFGHSTPTGQPLGQIDVLFKQTS